MPDSTLSFSPTAPATASPYEAKIKALTSFLPRLFLPLVLLAVASRAWKPLTGGIDFWAHAAIGRWIWQHQQPPFRTLFLWGAPPQEWIAHSWGSQLAFFGLMALGGPRWGPALAIGATMAISCLVFGLIWRLWVKRGGSRTLALLAMAPAIYASSPRLNPRPELFTALFFGVLLCWLVGWPQQKLRLQHAFALIAGFVLWANFHGAVAMGVVLLGATALVEVIQERGSRRSLILLTLAVACAGATLLNPYGLHLWLAVRPTPMFSSIDEWKPFWRHPLLGTNVVACEASLWAAALLVWIANPSRRWSHGLWLLLMGGAFLSARRHLWLLALTSLAVIAANGHVLNRHSALALWDGILAAWRALRRPRHRPVPDAPPEALGELDEEQGSRGAEEQGRKIEVLPSPSLPLSSAPRLPRSSALLPLVAQLFAITAFASLTLRGLSSDLQTRHFLEPTVPTGLSTHLKKHHPTARLFNDYEHSSYLQWALAGRPPLYIDLLNAYPDSLLDDYFEIASATPRGLQMMRRLKINCVALRPHDKKAAMAKLAAYLDAHPKQWQRVYRRGDGTVWVKRWATSGKAHTP